MFVYHIVYDWAPIFDYLVMPFDHVSLSDNSRIVLLL